YTHLQQAQAVPLAHHLLAYGWMLMRDRGRFTDVAGRLDESPLGAGAGGGSSLPLDPGAVADALGFGTVFANSMDAVASRDVAAEFVFCCAQATAHLSRLAEEIVMWATTEFGWARLPDAFATGSSALPHKKNPDIAELVRGRAAALQGDVVAILGLQKGLPLTYNRDLQEDKRLVFHADDTFAGCVEALGALVRTTDLDPPEPSGWVGALDLAEALVLRGVPFREAHHAVGRVVAALVAHERSPESLTMDDLRIADRRFTADDVGLLTRKGSVGRRATPGGGSPASVRTQIDRLRLELG
ncbi:MAG: argininosuccinate lyase, partial [Acidimicrobiia bacterium]